MLKIWYSNKSFVENIHFVSFSEMDFDTMIRENSIMDDITQAVVDEERFKRQQLVYEFNAACEDLAEMYNVGQLKVPVFTERIWTYVPFFPPIPLFYRTKVIFDFPVFKRWGVKLANDGYLVTGPGFLTPTWQRAPFQKWYTDEDLVEGTQRLKTVMKDADFLFRQQGEIVSTFSASNGYEMTVSDAFDGLEVLKRSRPSGRILGTGIGFHHLESLWSYFENPEAAVIEERVAHVDPDIFYDGSGVHLKASFLGGEEHSVYVSDAELSALRELYDHLNGKPASSFTSRLG